MDTIAVTVVYATVNAATEVRLDLPAGATIADALARANLLVLLPGVDVEACPVGIFGQRAGRNTVLAAGDRVELYRPLALDPKQARRRRQSAKRP